MMSYNITDNTFLPKMLYR